MFSSPDNLIISFDKALRVMAGIAAQSRGNPADTLVEPVMDASQRRHSAGLMRVNHVGEVCAQALYQSQGLFAQNTAVRHQFDEAGRDEEDHLAWTANRIRQLGSHLSLLNPVWYAGAFTLGAIAAKLGDSASLGFVVETERQVEAHLNLHLATLPVEDVKSRAIVAQMRDDEIAHGAAAQQLGATELPVPVKKVMTGMAKVMTSLAYFV